MLKTILEFIKEFFNYFWFYIKLFFSLFFMYYIFKNNLLYSLEEITYLNLHKFDSLNVVHCDEIKKNKELEKSINNIEDILKEKENIKKISIIVGSLFLLKIIYNTFFK